MHTGNSATIPDFPVQRQWSGTFTEDHLFTFSVEEMWHLNSILFQGIPERFPEYEPRAGPEISRSTATVAPDTALRSTGSIAPANNGDHSRFPAG